MTRNLNKFVDNNRSYSRIRRSAFHQDARSRFTQAGVKAGACLLSPVLLFLLMPMAQASQESNGQVRQSLESVNSREEFDSIARTYDANTPYALPHALFVIDRQEKNRI